MPFITPDLPELTVTSVIDVLAVTVLIYNLTQVLRGRRALHVMNGIAMLALFYGIAVWLHLDLLRTVLAAVAPYTPIALIVMFQSELRGWLARLGRIRGLGGQWTTLGSRLERREVVEEILSAVQQLTSTKTGALIVLERDIGLRTFIESGVALDAVVSRDLLCAIFQPGGELHDGAAIIQGDRIAAAACFLPLHVYQSNSPMHILKRLGSRHRAALGVTEGTDALAVVASEETGHISIAWKGELESDVSLERLAARLAHHALGTKRPAEDGSPEPELGSAQP